VKILLVDDHVIFRDGLKLVLDGLEAGIDFFEAGSCAEALHCIDGNVFDLILLDLHLPDSSGEQTLKAVCTQMGVCSVVVLSGEDSPAIIRDSIGQGASGFIPKSSKSKVLTAALRLILDGGVYLPPSALDDLRLPGGPSCHRTLSNNIPVEDIVSLLSGRQQEVLIHAIEGKSNKEIARAMNISEGTVKSHLSQVYRALGVKGRVEAAYAASKLGMVGKVMTH